MAWNGSDLSKSQTASEKKFKSRVQRGLSFRGLGMIFAVIAVVAAVIVAFYVLDRDTDKKNDSVKVQAKESKPRKITGREKLRKIVESKTGKTFNPDLSKPQKQDFGWYTNKMGEVKRKTSNEGFRIRARKTKRELFSNAAEMQIDVVVNTPLGQDIFDDSVPENFEEQFAYSLTNVIKITENDSPRDVERKQRVIEAKEQLVQMKKEGENLRDVLINHKRELMKKCRDYHLYERGLMELRAKNASSEEIAEYALAAKTMMQEREIEHPLTLTIEETEAMKELDKLINQN